ncbi:MAG: GvpL/GvpF family gas vesicle protein, partial [Ignavibacteriae bacterium]|nr:GvpL/GvpF family gas vesicle protein [Ignavibacteriota bacterium]
SLVKEFFLVLARYKNLSDFAREARQLAEHKIPPGFEPTPDPKPEEQSPRLAESNTSRPSGPLRVQPIHIGLPKIEIPTAESRPEATPPVAKKNAEELQKQLETIERLIQQEIQRDWDTRAGEIRETIVRLKDSQQELQEQIKAIEEPPAEEEKKPEVELLVAPDLHAAIGNDDMLCLYAVSRCENGEVTKALDRLKGIDDTNHIFALDTNGLRIILSKIRPERLTVTKSGILLLNKQESIHLRGVHESIVNVLRTVESVAPFEFGSVIHGKEAFSQTTSAAASLLEEITLQELSTTSWSVRVMVLDQRIAEIVGPSVGSLQRDRGRGDGASNRRFDIKTLERVLQYERTLAQMVHASLSERSTSSKVSLLVGFGSGTTEDWKPALQATYDVAEESRSAFFTSVCELQEQYKNLGAMLSVAGNVGRIALADLATKSAHAISA